MGNPLKTITGMFVSDKMESMPMMKSIRQFEADQAKDMPGKLSDQIKERKTFDAKKRKRLKKNTDRMDSFFETVDKQQDNYKNLLGL